MKEWIRRALRTFFQAFVACIVVNAGTYFTGITDANALKTATISLFVAAVAAGLAALMNYTPSENNK